MTGKSQTPDLTITHSKLRVSLVMHWALKSAAVPLAVIVAVEFAVGIWFFGLGNWGVRLMDLAAILFPFIAVLAASVIAFGAKGSSSLRARSFAIKVSALAFLPSIVVLYVTSVAQCLSTPYYLRTRISSKGITSKVPCFNIDLYEFTPYLTELVISGMLSAILVILPFKIGICWFAPSSELQKFDLPPMSSGEAIGTIMVVLVLALMAAGAIFILGLFMWYRSGY